MPICNGDRTMYYLPAGEETINRITDKEIKRYENCRFNSFDTYKSVYFNIWCVCLSNNPEKWKEATCICPSFMKNFVCKHTIGMSIKLKYCKPPPEMKIGTKRKEADHRKQKSLIDTMVSYIYFIFLFCFLSIINISNALLVFFCCSNTKLISLYNKLFIAPLM